MPWIDRLITYITDSQNNEDPEPYSKSYSAGGTELPTQELLQKTSKKQKIQQITQEPPSTHNLTKHTDNNKYIPDQHMQDPTQDLTPTSDPHTHTSDTLNKPYPIEVPHPPPKPCKLRPPKTPKTPNIQNRKMHPQNPHNDHK